MHQGQDIVIAGVGLITPLGRTVHETWRNLLAGRSISEHGRAIERGDGDEPNVIELADIAAREAIAEVDWDDQLHDDRTALIVGTSKGPADEWLATHSGTGYQPVALQPQSRAVSPCHLDGNAPFDPPTSDKPSCEDVTPVPVCEDVTPDPICESVPARTAVLPEPARPRIWGLHEIAEVLAGRLATTGPRLTVTAACASGLHALIRGVMMLRHGDADRVLVVASESSLHEAFIQSFRRLGVIATPGEPCRPMDENRSGFLISEAAAAVCLERRRAKPGEVVVDACAMGADASHLTGTDPQALALKTCLSRTVNGHPIDLIHAHATGTVANDPIELAAIETICRDASAVYSHKGAIGHTLGASGLVATVLNVLAHRTGLVPGNINTRRPLETSAGRIHRERCKRPIRRSVAIAAGFGGATGVVGLRTASN